MAASYYLFFSENWKITSNGKKVFLFINKRSLFILPYLYLTRKVNIFRYLPLEHSVSKMQTSANNSELFTALKFKKEDNVIKNVWKYNLHEEFDVIRKIVSFINFIKLKLVLKCTGKHKFTTLQKKNSNIKYIE